MHGTKKRKRVLAVLFSMLSIAFAGTAIGAEVTLAWTGSPGATSYRIYQSVDQGQTWTVAIDSVPQPDPFPANGEVSVKVENVPEDTLVLFKAGAVRGADEFPTPDKGAWYDHRLMPPSAVGLGAR